MKKEKVKLTEMQQFALDFLKKTPGEVNPSYLGSQWFQYKNDGRFPPAASRYSFGTTSAAYRTLRKLAELKLVNHHIRKTAGGMTFEHFSHKK